MLSNNASKIGNSFECLTKPAIFLDVHVVFVGLAFSTELFDKHLLSYK